MDTNKLRDAWNLFITFLEWSEDTALGTYPKVKSKKPPSELQNVLDAIEATRQTGNTTHLARMAANANGTLIVRDHQQREHAKKLEPSLNVVTIWELKHESGCIKAPIFFDNSAVHMIASLNAPPHHQPRPES